MRRALPRDTPPGRRCAIPETTALHRAAAARRYPAMGPPGTS